MAITANGIGSGLDINGLVNQLMSLEQRPLTALVSKEASYQAKLSAFGQVKSVLSSLQTAVNGLDSAAKFAGTKATVGSEAGFTASSGPTASAGSYSIRVDQLASAQRIATKADGSGFAPGEGAGSLTINFGTFSDSPTPTFTADSEREATLEFAGGSLEDLRDAINADKALGVSASIVFNGTAKQLVLSGSGTGAEKAFSLAGTGSLSALSFNPESAGTASSDVYTLENARDARLNISGIDITRGSNTITDAIDDVTLTLTKETTTAASLAVAEDRSSARSAIEGFVKAYNESVKALKELTAYNTETKAAAILTGDATARGIQNQLRAMVGGTLSGLGTTTRLADIGLSFQRDGTLAIDSSKLSAALDDPERGVAEFFTGIEGESGFAKTLSQKLDAYVGSDGLISGRTDGINSSIKAIDKQRENLITRLESVEKRYRAQFTALDSMVASMTQTSNYLAQQLANLPKIE